MALGFGPISEFAISQVPDVSALVAQPIRGRRVQCFAAERRRQPRLGNPQSIAARFLPRRLRPRPGIHQEGQRRRFRSIFPIAEQIILYRTRPPLRRYDIEEPRRARRFIFPVIFQPKLLFRKLRPRIAVLLEEPKKLRQKGQGKAALFTFRLLTRLKHKQDDFIPKSRWEEVFGEQQTLPPGVAGPPCPYIPGRPDESGAPFTRLDEQQDWIGRTDEQQSAFSRPDEIGTHIGRTDEEEERRPRPDECR